MIIPKTDAEVFSGYYSRIKYLVSRSGIRSDYVEDYSMTLVEKFIRKEVLSDFDPEKRFEEQRTATFLTFLSGFVRSYLWHFAERDRILADRSAYSTNHSFLDSEDSEVLAIDTQVSYTDDLSSVEVDYLIQQARRRYGTTDRERLFFDAVIQQARETGKVNGSELATTFGVTRASVHLWMKKLREVFRECQADSMDTSPFAQN